MEKTLQINVFVSNHADRWSNLFWYFGSVSRQTLRKATISIHEFSHRPDRGSNQITSICRSKVSPLELTCWAFNSKQTQWTTVPRCFNGNWTNSWDLTLYKRPSDRVRQHSRCSKIRGRTKPLTVNKKFHTNFFLVSFLFFPI
jgi:hypothetical protein